MNEPTERVTTLHLTEWQIETLRRALQTALDAHDSAFKAGALDRDTHALEIGRIEGLAAYIALERYALEKGISLFGYARRDKQAPEEGKAQREVGVRKQLHGYE